MTLFERAVYQFQANLPMLLAAGLAGFTWWLIQASPKDTGPAQPTPASTRPDYVLNGATVARFDPQGHLVGVIDGQSIRHYSADDRLQIDDMVLSARDAQGQGLHAVAREGEANGKAEVVVIRGGAKVVATPASGARTADKGLQGPVRLTGEIFRLDSHAHVLTSDQPVTVENNSARVHADALRYEQLSGVTELKGHVTGVYQQTPADSSARR
ncbi:MAG TPA: LPS export ABC transporter periplasmic protein LptC [Aquabacterium sp.]|nr:LPS export ABC transporter periplasmic protein LptC [Aquabacterium sp.]